MVTDNADDAQLFFGQPDEAGSGHISSHEGKLNRFIPECAHGGDPRSQGHSVVAKVARRLFRSYEKKGEECVARFFGFPILTLRLYVGARPAMGFLLTLLSRLRVCESVGLLALDIVPVSDTCSLDCGSK